MWALRRAANPLRSQSHRIVVARSCCAETELLNGSSKHGVHSEGEKQVIGGFVHPKPFSYFSSRSFFWTRNLSSQAGAKSSDSEDDALEDGFSDLETPPKADIADVEDVNSEGEISEEEADNAEGALGLLDAESGGEKTVGTRMNASPLLKILMDSPRTSINSALDKWVSEGKPLGRQEISLVLHNLRRRRFWGKALQFLEWVEANERLEFTGPDYASYLDLIAKIHGIQKAEKFIEKIPQSFKGEVVYRTLLANCVASGNVKKSEEVFNRIRDLDFPLTTFACNQLLLLYKRIDRKKIADILKLMEKEKVKPSLFTYRLLIDTKGRENDISGMEELVELMKAEGTEPDLAIHSILARNYIYGNLKEKAEAVLKEIEGDDIKGNRAACKELLPLYASLGKSDDVERIWKVCEANPRLEECLAATEAWGKLGKIEKAEEVFEHMVNTWKRLSPRYYNAMIKVYGQHKLLSKGKDLAKRMSENGCKIGPLTWDALVKLYVEAGEVEKADSLLQKATQQNQMRPLYSSYMAVLDKYAKRGDIHNAEKIFLKLRQNGYSGRMRLYQLLLQAYINAKTPAYGFRERMKADNMFPNKAVAAQLGAIEGFNRKTPISELLD
ncbi:pentatricopeptide repeat-containing protein At1g80270, mitochondrial-like [Asparagus officinalis]|uniref:pentatricopeptide repeat-containing protein At1g80270, mitochondrial-like n=1 Tax=Asparagus officinalis TaxID=4686 RepID=UPI00098DFF1E|nr:pentatricopeptide repeat-containing protein At1g80270, mitochondrial-like [Asparagus officinalis]